MYEHIFNSPMGPLLIKASEDELLSISFEPFTSGKENINDVIRLTEKQLVEYFEGNRKEFNIPFCIPGTPFQKAVYKALLEIPYGKTVSYKDIAIRIGNEKAVRAVGGANNKNIIPIIIPCHRVIGKNGSLVGYAAGLESKVFLLELEQSI